jgi:hypothetical protein
MNVIFINSNTFERHTKSGLAVRCIAASNRGFEAGCHFALVGIHHEQGLFTAAVEARVFSDQGCIFVAV